MATPKLKIKRTRKVVGYFSNEIATFRLISLGLLVGPVGYWCVSAAIIFAPSFVGSFISHLEKNVNKVAMAVSCDRASKRSEKDILSDYDSSNDSANSKIELRKFKKEKLKEYEAQSVKMESWTNLVTEQAEQNDEPVAQYIEPQLYRDLDGSNDSCAELTAFWADDIFSNFFANIGLLLGKWAADYLFDWRMVSMFAALFLLQSSRSGFCRSLGRKWKFTAARRRSLSVLFWSNRRTWRQWKSWHSHF
ncbi:MAG: hypothetical protein WC028_25270 [Candidatus Obscuribacterales bacterium]